VGHGQGLILPVREGSVEDENFWHFVKKRLLFWCTFIRSVFVNHAVQSLERTRTTTVYEAQLLEESNNSLAPPILNIRGPWPLQCHSE